jgi:hypothetical protein
MILLKFESDSVSKPSVGNTRTKFSNRGTLRGPPFHLSLFWSKNSLIEGKSSFHFSSQAFKKSCQVTGPGFGSTPSATRLRTQTIP